MNRFVIENTFALDQGKEDEVYHSVLSRHIEWGGGADFTISRKSRLHSTWMVLVSLGVF